MVRLRRVARGVVSLLVVAAGVGPWSGYAAAVPSAGPSTPPFVAAAPKWTKCADAAPGAGPAQCADIRVPLSWARPQGPTISLRLSRLAALDSKHRLGVLLFNPGGPGGPGAEVISESGRSLMPAELQRRFDIIGFDPRGVGDSTAVTCTGAALSPKVAVFPDSKGQFAAVRRQSAAYGSSCIKHSAPGLVANVDTVSAARDMDVIRVALGQQKISYLGVSYGTFLGQTYARLFPHRVQTMVLDGAMDHAVSPAAFLDEEASSLSEVFGRFARWCTASKSCALHGKDVTAIWDGLLARAARTPIPAPHAGGGATTVNADAIRMVLPNLLLFGPTSSLVPSSWPELGRAIAQAQAGDASLMAENSDVGQPQDAYAAVGCMDFPTQVRGYADAARRLKQARALSPHTGAASEAWLITDLCAGWPLPSTDPWGPQKITGTPPILVASTRYDPSTPLVWAQGLHREITGSALLIADVTGHTAYFNSGCARNAETAYLITGKLPVSDRCGA
ncbi:alpha/beta hydrolase [Streptantibioticus rubrisoli]|uniref:Alpha/beta hydrolase n=1 Tax=Streptantibioticus rubrisoli TaxID=1387313 RepID=A0ABT1PEB0_9ACTN|nr:alpha/beta hydrolase [Streptantibioticus rubrisoli]MCQ4043702.1 alpha/beta hydrolase [Streptantibioticus rubrisoli]